MQGRSRRHLRGILSIMVIQINEKSTSVTTKNKNLDVVTGAKRNYLPFKTSSGWRSKSTTHPISLLSRKDNYHCYPDLHGRKLHTRQVAHTGQSKIIPATAKSNYSPRRRPT